MLRSLNDRKTLTETQLNYNKQESCLSVGNNNDYDVDDDDDAEEVYDKEDIICWRIESHEQRHNYQQKRKAAEEEQYQHQQQQQKNNEKINFQYRRRRFCLQYSSSSFTGLTVLFTIMWLIFVGATFVTVAVGNQIDGSPQPVFISRSETFKFIAGETMLLPCDVKNAESYIVAWKRGIAILSAGSIKVTPDSRVRLVNGFSLQIKDAGPQDAGDYICQIATLQPREITHTVEILVPPQIHHISSGGHIQMKKGATVRIECLASGNPNPNITWSRKNNVLPNGDEKLHSTLLTVENLDRHKSGIYICTASNGVGEPASSQVVLHVLYSPEITIESPIVYSAEGHEAMLVCIVHGETQPEVIWFKETMQLDTTERHIMENRGSRHTLIIRKVHQQDFGNYSCVAENKLGKSRQTLVLTGRPKPAVIRSPYSSQYRDKYNISWTVDSLTSVEEFKLLFRRQQKGHDIDNSIEQTNQRQSIQLYNYQGFGNSLHWPRNDWRDVVLPALPPSHHLTQSMSYMIRGLEPDQHYEAKVQSRNRYGWSELTESFAFCTSINDLEMRDLSVKYLSKSAFNKTSTNYISYYLLIIIQFIFLL